MGRKAATHCKDCKIELTPLNIVWRGHNDKSARCHDCLRKQQREKMQKLRDGTSLNRIAHLRKTFNLTMEEYDKLVEFQQGGCAICRQPCPQGNLSIDHNHKTNEIRGLLCRKCNMVLGLLGEDEDYIWEILEYLKKTTWKIAVQQEERFDGKR